MSDGHTWLAHRSSAVLQRRKIGSIDSKGPRDRSHG